MIQYHIVRYNTVNRWHVIFLFIFMGKKLGTHLETTRLCPTWMKIVYQNNFPIGVIFLRRKGVGSKIQCNYLHPLFCTPTKINSTSVKKCSIMVVVTLPFLVELCCATSCIRRKHTRLYATQKIMTQFSVTWENSHFPTHLGLPHQEGSSYSLEMAGPAQRRNHYWIYVTLIFA